MLGQRLRRWAYIIPTLGERHVFSHCMDYIEPHGVLNSVVHVCVPY